MSDVLVGVVSDTHGGLSRAARTALLGVDHILHAGDIGSLEVVDHLKEIAPVTAVFGNLDPPEISRGLQLVAGMTVGDVEFVIAHERRDLPRVHPDPGRWLVLVTGHTHVPEIDVDEAARTIWLNPGSPSKARAGSGRNIAIVTVSTGVPRPRFVTL